MLCCFLFRLASPRMKRQLRGGFRRLLVDFLLHTLNPLARWLLREG